MLRTSKCLSFVAGVAVSGLLLIGCSDKQDGQPQPDPTTGAAGTSGSAPSSSSSGGTDQTLAAVKPCELLTDQEVSQFQAQGSGAPDDNQAAGSTSSCGWHGHSSDDRSVSFGIDIRAEQGLDELRANGGTISNGKVNSRDARQLQTPAGGCILALGVGPNSRVDISVVVGGAPNATESCQIASSLGNIVEPKLPPEAN